MKKKVFLRVGKIKKGYKVAVNPKPSPSCLSLSDGHGGVTDVPTVAFAIELNIPDELFEQAEKVIASVDVATEKATVLEPVVTLSD